LSQFAKLPTPLKDFKQIKVIFPYILTTNLYARNLDAYVNKFASSKITKETISANTSDYVVVVRPNMKVDIERITAPRGNLIYSMWDGYKKKPYTMDFLDWFTSKSFTIVDIHTSGHADTPTLKRLVAAIKPKYIVPIHTSKGENYQDIFDYPIVRLKDGEVQEV
ncbi:MAG: MBL fold metallo-hydrolase, partial [Bacteroidales bacterium]|nr:MBL fold metallo-hydrolase [Bacteroidales bacterium]